MPCNQSSVACLILVHKSHLFFHFPSKSVGTCLTCLYSDQASVSSNLDFLLPYIVLGTHGAHFKVPGEVNCISQKALVNLWS
jgi:hypothetical protein